MLINNTDTDKKVFIIAEIGNNHQGNLETCKKLIASAKKSRGEFRKVTKKIK